MNAPTENPATAGLWLGRLREATHLYARLERLAELVDGAWVPVSANVAMAKRMITASPKALGPHETRGSIWSFEVSPPSPGGEKPKAESPKRAFPVINLSEVPLEEARAILLKKGLSVFPQYQGRQALVLLEGGACCLLKFEPHGKDWRAKLPDGPIILHSTDRRWKTGGDVAGHGWLPQEPDLTGDSVGMLDWTTDEQFLARLTERMRSAMDWQASADSSSATKERLRATLSTAADWAKRDRELSAMLERVRRDWGRLSSSASALAGIGELLVSTDVGQRLLREATTRVAEHSRVEIERSIRQEVEASLIKTRSELETAKEATKREREAVTDLERRRAQLMRERDSDAEQLRTESIQLQKVRDAMSKEEIERQRARRQHDEAVSARHEHEHRIEELKSLEDKLHERIEQLMLSLDDVLQRGNGDSHGVANFAAEIAALLEGTGMGDLAPIPAPHSIPPWWGVRQDSSIEVKVDQLHGRLSEEGKDHGLELDDLLVVDAMARAGELVVLTGANARLALRAYSRVVAGDAVRFQPLDPSVIGLDDLWRTPSTGRPTALAIAWQRAKSRPRETVILCLSDFDSAPFHLWLGSLHSALDDLGRPPNLLVFATLGVDRSEGSPHPCEDAMRERLVAVHTRSNTSNAPKATLGLFAPATALEWSSPLFEDEVHSDALALAGEGKSYWPVRRAVRFRLAAEMTKAEKRQRWALAWSAYLRTGQLGHLPEPLLQGALDAASINYRN